MAKNNGFPIREDWKDYYFFLEGLMRTEKCNRWSLHTYLAEYFNISEELAKVITDNWQYNYEELNLKYSWRKVEEPKKEVHKKRRRKS